MRRPTGADVSVLSLKEYNRLVPRPTLRPTNASLCSPGGKMTCKGQFTSRVQVRNHNGKGSGSGGRNVWDGIWFDDNHDVVQIGSNKQQVFVMLWHSCETTTRWHSKLADDVSFIHFPLHLHTAYMSTSTSTVFSLASLTDNSLYISTVYILTHNVLLALPGHAQKSTQNHNNLRRCSLHSQQPLLLLTARLPNLVSPFLLTSSQLYTHSPNSRSLLSCLANQIPDQSIQPMTKDLV